VAPVEDDAAPPAHATSRARRVSARLFPGERWVWRGAGAVTVVLGIVLLVALLQPREVFTGSNSVAGRDYVAEADGGQTLIERNQLIPAGTGRVRFQIDTRTSQLPALKLTLRFADGTVIHGSNPGTKTPGFRKVDVPLQRPVPGGAEARLADVELRPATGTIFLWGRGQLDDTSKPIQVGKTSYNGRVALWYLPKAHERRPILGQLGAMFRRASLFRPGFVGPWTYWLLLFIVMPLLGYAAIRTIAVADGLARRLPLRVFAIGFALAATWALITPAFESPDESEHFAAVQYVAETGRAVDATPGSRPPWSSQEAWAIDQTRELSTIERSEAKAPWLELEQRAWEKGTRLATSQTDGGGFHPTTAGTTPVYYALLAPAYLLVHHESVFSQLLAMRWTSAIMGGLVAMLAMLLILELLPRRRSLAVAGGLLVATLPQFGFISGAVNSDNGVNLGVALCIYLTVRALHRGLTPRVAVALGAALVVTPLLKGTGYAIYPPVILALVLMFVRRHGRRDWMSLGVVAASFVVFFLIWAEVRGTFHRSAFTTPGGSTPGDFVAVHNIKAYLSWLWQVMVPVKLPFMTDFTIVHWPFFNIYVERGFAGFGWYAIFFPKWVYSIVVVVMIGTLVFAARTMWVARGATLKRYLPEILFLASVPIVVIAAVEAAYYPGVAGLPIDGTGEQGRYAFPAITAMAAIIVAGCLGFGRRRAAPIAAALVAGLMMLGLASQFLTLSTFYT
jgi:hypothetical protein